MSAKASTTGFKLKSVYVWLGLGVILVSSSAAADTCTWDGTTGNWNDPAKWSCNQEPSAGDNAVISSGVVSVTADATVDGLTLFGSGTLQGDANLEVTVSLNWTDGGMTGTGKTIVPDGGTLSISGNGSKNLERDLDNGGTATWSGSQIGGSAIFTNLSTGTFTIQNDRLLGTGSAIFNNNGMVIKTGDGGETTMNSQFIQSGTGSVDVQSGVMRFNEGGTIDGALTATGTTLRFSHGTFTLETSSTITATNVEYSGTTVTVDLGDPNYSVTNTTVSGGVVDFNASPTTFPNLAVSGGTVNFNAPTTSLTNLTQSGGVLQGSGDVEVTTLLSWTGGSMRGTGKTVVPDGATLTIAGSDNKNLERELDNGGTATWSSTGLFSGPTGTFSNLSTGTFTIQNDELIGVGSPVFNNAGMVIKTAGGGETTFSMPFNQSATGSLDVQAGDFNLNGGGTIEGEITATGTTLRFSAGQFTLADELSFAAVTNLKVTGGSLDMSNITDLTLVNFSQSGGTLNVDHPGVLVQGDFVRSGGTFIHGKGRIIFGGETTQNLSLSASTQFFYLEVTPNTLLVETDEDDNATINGFLRNRGTIQKTQAIPVNGNVTFGLTDFELDIVDPGTFTFLEVNRIGMDHPNHAPLAMPGQYWQMIPVGGGFTVDLTLNHCIQPDAEMLLCRYTGAAWDCAQDLSTPTSITRVGMTQLDEWAMGAVDPDIFMTGFTCGNVSAWSDVRGLC